MAVEVGFGGAERGLALGFDGIVLELEAPQPFPAGQPMPLALIAESGSVDLQGKSLGSKRRSDGRFVVRVRLINLRRSERELLQALFGRGGSSTNG